MREWKTTTIQKEDGSKEVFQNTGRTSHSIKLDSLRGHLLVTEDDGVHRHERRIPMDSVREYSIRQTTYDGPSYHSMPSEINCRGRTAVYRKGTYRDGMGVLRTTFDEVESWEGVGFGRQKYWDTSELEHESQLLQTRAAILGVILGIIGAVSGIIYALFFNQSNTPLRDKVFYGILGGIATIGPCLFALAFCFFVLYIIWRIILDGIIRRGRR